jgi:hypothetical protein
MNFSHLANDLITLIKIDGSKIENIKAHVQPKTIFIFDEKVPLEEGDKIYRKLPSNLIETFVVIDRGFYGEIAGMKAHYQAKVKKEANMDQEKYKSIINYNFANGTNSRINIDSTDLSKNNFNSEDIFENLKNTLLTIKDEEIKKKALELIEEMKNTKGTNSFSKAYVSFIGIMADHLGLINIFIPQLSQMILH